MAKQVPVISIIVPVYNVEEYVSKCIGSMLSLNMELIEILIIDDGSTDTSGNICDCFAEEHSNIYVFHQNNQGLSAARNRGIREARGKFLLFVDSDDYIESEIVEKIINAVQIKPDLEVIFLTAKKVYPNGKQIYLDEIFDRDKIINHNQEEVIKYLASLKKYPGSACTKAVKKSLIVQNKIFFEEGKTSEDLKWCLQVFLNANKFDVLQGDYYFYRQQREGSITQSYNENKLFCMMEVISDSCILAKSNVAVEEAIYSFMAYEYVISLLIYCYGRKNISKDKLKRCRKFFNQYQFLLLYKKGASVKSVRYLLKIFGVDVVSNLIGLYYRIKGKWIKYQ